MHSLTTPWLSTAGRPAAGGGGVGDGSGSERPPAVEWWVSAAAPPPRTLPAPRAGRTAQSSPSVVGEESVKVEMVIDGLRGWFGGNVKKIQRIKIKFLLNEKCLTF